MLSLQQRINATSWCTTHIIMQTCCVGTWSKNNHSTTINLHEAVKPQYNEVNGERSCHWKLKMVCSNYTQQKHKKNVCPCFSYCVVYNLPMPFLPLKYEPTRPSTSFIDSPSYCCNEYMFPTNFQDKLSHFCIRCDFVVTRFDCIRTVTLLVVSEVNVREGEGMER